MSRKNETRVSEVERVKLAEVQAALNKATNAHRRSEIALATAQQDQAEVMQALAKRYKLGAKDAVDALTGEIVRAGAEG